MFTFSAFFFFFSCVFCFLRQLALFTHCSWHITWLIKYFNCYLKCHINLIKIHHARKKNWIDNLKKNKINNKNQLSICLDPRSRFQLLLFFHSFSAFWENYHCSRTVHRTYNHFIQKNILKMGLTVLFTHLKIILLQWFQFQQK